MLNMALPNSHGVIIYFLMDTSQDTGYIALN
jgi:hypothetical protein